MYIVFAGRVGIGVDPHQRASQKPTDFEIHSFKNRILRSLHGKDKNRLAPDLKTICHQCVISYTCSLSNSDGSVLKQSHQS